MQVIGRTHVKLGYEVKIEPSCLITLGVNQESPTADLISDHEKPSDCILKKCGAKSLPFVTSIDTKPSKQRHRLRVAPRALREPLRRVGVQELCHRPRVVGDHMLSVIFGDNEHLGRASRRRLLGVASEPGGLFARSTFEAVDDVVG